MRLQCPRSTSSNRGSSMNTFEAPAEVCHTISPGMPYLPFTVLCEKVRRQAEDGMF